MEDIIIQPILKILCIGDPHFSIKNRQRCLNFIDKCIEKVKQLKEQNQLDLIICLGDIFHTHEKAHMLECKDVIDFLNKCQKICKTILIIGNHDRLNNKVFCTEEHFLYMHNKTVEILKYLNMDKQIKTNLIIVDKPQAYKIKGHTIGLIPYVDNGRFEEAFQLINSKDITNIKYIFCHQEFKGCKMNNITSRNGDIPNDNYIIFSGHIHDKQIMKYKVNSDLSIVHYIGTPFQQRYGEDPNKTISHITINTDYNIKEIDLGISKLITKEISVIEFNNTFNIDNISTNLRLIVYGKEDELNILKKNKKYKQMKKKGVKFLFKLIREEQQIVKKNAKFLDKFIEIISEDENAVELFNELTSN